MTDLPKPLKGARTYTPYEGTISVETKRELIKKYDELKLDQLPKEMAVQELAMRFPDLGINRAKVKRILDRRDYLEADDG